MSPRKKTEIEPETRDADVPPEGSPAQTLVAPAPAPAKSRPNVWLVVAASVVGALLFMAIGARIGFGIARRMEAVGFRRGFAAAAPQYLRGQGAGRGQGVGRGGEQGYRR